MLLPGRIFLKYFARVVLPEQVAPLNEKKLVDVCIPGDCGECAPYADDDYPLLSHGSVQILSEGRWNRKRGKETGGPSPAKIRNRPDFPWSKPSQQRQARAN